VNYYKFEITDTDLGVVEATISIKGNLYFTQCTCDIYEIKRCKHINSVVAGRTENLNEEGIRLQEKMLQELKQSQSGLYYINSTRMKAKTPPFCEKCKELMEPIEQKQNFLKKLLGTKHTNPEFICKNCGRMNSFNI
jgi:hypothetical protein